MPHSRQLSLLEGELRRLSSEFSSCSLAFDGLSTLYAATIEGDFLGADIRQEVLVEEGEQSFSTDTDGSSRTHKRPSFLRPQPELQPLVSHFEVGSDGRFAIVAGPDSQDAELSAAAILDLRAAKLLPGRDASAHSAPVAADLFARRPGLRVLQVSWHPGSAKHFAMLSSDNTFRLFCLDDLQLAEQTFHLELQEGGGLGLNAEESGQAVAFAFGQGGLWQSFTVYFLTMRAAVYMLCPIAPFQSRVPCSLVAALQEAAGSDGKDSVSMTTTAWLQQAFEARGRASPLSSHAEVSPTTQQTLPVQPHALREHSPLLQGPLPVTCPDAELLGLGGMSPSHRTTGVSLAWIRGRGECALLCAATAEGLIGWHLIAHAPEPDWADYCPNCIVSNNRILAVHHQVPRSEGCASELLLLAAAQVGSSHAEDADGLWEGRPSVRLLVNPLQPAHVYCIHPHGAYLLATPWILALADVLSPSLGNGYQGQQIDLRSTTVEELWAATGDGPHCSGATVVSNALAGTALVLATSDGRVSCLRPAAAPNSLLVAEGPRGQAEEPDITAAELKAKYGDILHGPRNVAMPQILPADAAQPEGHRLLIASITALKAKHVQYIIQTHSKLLPELEQALASAEGQENRAQQISRVAAALEKRGQAISERLEKALRWDENLNSRVRLLAELHWSLPHPLSTAEARFRNQELPNLEREVQQLQESVQQLRRRADAVAGGKPQQTSAEIPVPAAQVKGLRAALAQQADLSGEARDMADRMEAQLQRLESAAASELLVL